MTGAAFRGNLCLPEGKRQCPSRRMAGKAADIDNFRQDSGFLQTILQLGA